MAGKPHQKRNNGPLMKQDWYADSSGAHLQRGVESQWREASANSDNLKDACQPPGLEQWADPTGLRITIQRAGAHGTSKPFNSGVNRPFVLEGRPGPTPDGHHCLSSISG